MKAFGWQQIPCSVGAYRDTTRCWRRREKWTFCQSWRRFTSWKMAEMAAQVENICFYMFVCFFPFYTACHRTDIRLIYWIKKENVGWLHYLFLCMSFRQVSVLYAADPGESDDDDKEFESFSAGSQSATQCPMMSKDSEPSVAGLDLSSRRGITGVGSFCGSQNLNIIFLGVFFPLFNFWDSQSACPQQISISLPLYLICCNF